MRYDPDSGPMVVLGWFVAAGLAALLALVFMILRGVGVVPAWL